jgi:hypothetical protein
MREVNIPSSSGVAAMIDACLFALGSGNDSAQYQVTPPFSQLQRSKWFALLRLAGRGTCPRYPRCEPQYCTGERFPVDEGRRWNRPPA